MTGPDPNQRAIPDPRVLSDEAVYIATTARRLQLLADALEASALRPDAPAQTYGPDGGGPYPPTPGTPDWVGLEGENALNGQGLHQALVEGASAYDLWLAAYVVGVRAAARGPDFPTNPPVFPIPPFNFLKDLVPLVDDPSGLAAFVYACPVRWRDMTIYGVQGAREALVEHLPPDLDAAMGMVAQFGYEPPAPYRDPDVDPERIGGLPIATVAKVCLDLYAAGGAENVQTFLTTINDPRYPPNLHDEEDAE